jgi:hypothetical protein
VREEVPQLGADVAEETREAQPWEEVGLGRADVCVRRDQELFRLPDVGPPLQERRGQPRGHVRRKSHERALSWNGLGIAAEEEVDLVLPGHDRALDLGDLRRDQRQRGLGACRLQAGGRSALQPAVEQVVGVLERGGRALRDRELGVQLAQVHVGHGDVRHQGKEDPAAPLLRREVLGAGGLAEPPDASPQVQLPREPDVHGPRGDRRARGVQDRVGAAALPSPLVVDGGIELRADDAIPGPRLLHPRRREPGVEAVADGFLDEALQDRVVEHVPPRHVRERARLRRALVAVEALGHRHQRTLVVGTDGAAGEREGQGAQGGGTTRAADHGGHASAGAGAGSEGEA